MKPTRSFFVTALVLLLSASFVPAAAWAQSQATGGNIQGVVRDPDGMPLPGALVTVTSMDTGRVRTTYTSGSGTYRVPVLPVGAYVVRAELEGFQPVERENIVLSLGAALDVDFQLQIATVQEVLTIVGQAPIVETTKTQVSTTIDEESIDSLPILGRDFTDFALLTPGAQLETSRNTVALSGQRGISTSINIDGTSNNSAFFGYQRGGTDAPFTVSQESVQEFQVVTSGIMPEFGRSGGGLVNVVTKSGTNDWRGGAHFYWRDQGLTSADPFGREQNDFQVYQYGGSLGGPIVRNESFIFASADVQDFQIPYFVDYGLSDAEFAALQSYVSQYRPNWDIRQTQHTRTNDALVLFGKWDQSIGDDTQLSVRANWSNHETVGGGTDTNLQGTTNASQSSLGDQTEDTLSIVAQLTSVLGDRAFNELRVQYSYDDLDRLSNDLDGPDTDIRGPFVQLGRRFFMPIFVREKKIQIQDNFSYLFDDHDVKAGFDIESDKTSEFFSAFAAGEFRFNSVPLFLANKPAFFQQGFGVSGSGFDPNFDVRQTVAGAYIQDSWRVNDKLTVNYGLRWEGTFNPTPPGNPAIADTQQIPDDTNNWQPRFGVAYAPSSKTVFRLSSGLFYSRTPTLLFFNPYTSKGLPGEGVYFFSNSSGALDGLWPNIFPSLPPGISTQQEVYWFSPDYEEAQTLRINAGVEHEIVQDFSLGLSYVFARANGLQSLYNTNLRVAGRDANGRMIYNGVIQPGVQWRIDQSNSFSRYHAAIFEFKKRFSNGWGGFGSYTYSVDKDTDSQERSASGNQVTNIADLRDDWGYSDRDIKHRVVVAGYGDLPLGFKLSGTFVWNTGRPYTGLLRSDVNRDSVTNDRPVVFGSVQERNAYRQPEFKTLDLRLSWELSTGFGRFQFLADAFNVFNWSNKFTTNTQYDTAQFGTLNTFIGNVRQLQLGVRFIY